MTSITVVGSIAFDSVRTPFGRRDRMLGGAATHFALAASFFADVHVVGCVGADFTGDDFAVLRTRGTRTSDVEVVPGGRTFSWAGEYGDDLNARTTLDTQLNVFAHFAPALGRAARGCDVLFLANIQPALQLSVLDQCPGARWTALDSMDLWIDTAREDLVRVVERVDCVVLNDGEVRQLTGKASIVGAITELLSWGPTAVVVKQGEYGSVLGTAEGIFALPAFPVASVVDPTGAGDTFAGGLVGCVASRAGSDPGHDDLVAAMAYGTALASFNVEELGTDRVARLAEDDVHARVDELRRMTRSTHPSVAAAPA